MNLVRPFPLKGIDNHVTTVCCRIMGRYYINDTGTGNTLNLSHGRVIQMVLARANPKR